VTDQPKVYLYSEFEGTAYVSLVSAKVNTNDTITLGDYTTISTALAFRKDTGVQVATSLNGSVITFTTTNMTNVQVHCLLWGQKQ
jgi:hypothetical protein